MRCTDRRCECKLFRKMWLTSREGSRRRRTLHGIAAGPSTGSRHTSPLLPIEGAVTIARAIEEQCAPPAERIRQRPQHGCTTVAARAHRRAHCAGVLLLVTEQRAAALTRTPVHVWRMHHVLTTVPFTAGTQRQQMVGYDATATAETAWVAALVRLVHVLCARSNAAAPASTTSSRSRIARSRLCGRLCGRRRC